MDVDHVTGRNVPHVDPQAVPHCQVGWMVQPLKMAALAGALCTCIYPGLLANVAGVVGVAGFPEVVGTG